MVCSEHADADELQSLNARRASLGEVLGASKVVSLHKGLTNESRGIIGARELALLRPGTVLVNTARAALIDERALLARLARNDLVAALDVYEEEPLPGRHPLRKLRSVILTPHNASTTAECDRRVGKQALDILQSWITGGPVPALSASQMQRMT
jgi:phosphoglycerate dehydrogenase-like enzyme